LDVAAADHVQLSNIFVSVPVAATDSYAIDLGSNNLVGAYVNGNNAATCHGIRTAGGMVTGCVVRDMNGGNGITSTSAEDVIADNFAKNLNGGTPYVFATGATAWNNYPWQDGLVYRNAAASTAVTSTTETDFDKSYTIGANRLRAGAVIRIRAQAFVTSAAGGGTLNLRLKIGGIVIEETGAVAAGSSFLGYFDATLIVRTIGSSGTIVGTTLYGMDTYDVVTPKIGFLGSNTINTTVAQTIKMSAQWSNSGNSVRLDIFSVEILSSGDVG
jgi:hypothetical protein